LWRAARQGDQPVAPTNPFPFLRTLRSLRPIFPNPNLILCDLCIAIHDNFRGLRKFFESRRPSDSHTPRAKNAKDAKFGNQFLFFAPFASFARDIPNFGCGSAAHGFSW
jgi:hypothetical protein